MHTSQAESNVGSALLLLLGEALGKIRWQLTLRRVRLLTVAQRKLYVKMLGLLCIAGRDSFGPAFCHNCSSHELTKATSRSRSTTIKLLPRSVPWTCACSPPKIASWLKLWHGSTSSNVCKCWAYDRCCRSPSRLLENSKDGAHRNARIDVALQMWATSKAKRRQSCRPKPISPVEPDSAILGGMFKAN